MPTYLDYAASTPLAAEVLTAMTDAAALVGNPSATHSFGRAARLAVDVARREVAAFLAAHEDEVVFTSGATEANNAALLGFWHSLSADERAGARLLVSPLEHASVLEAIRLMEAEGAVVDWLAVDGSAVVSADAAASRLTPTTVLVACQWVNNAFGTIQPVAELGKAVAAERQRRGAGGRPLFFHVDAVQAARFIELHPAAVGADTLSLSAHKLYGPKGVGCLWQRRGAVIAPRLVGGGQESGRRAGTESIMGVVAFGVAVRLATERRDEEQQQAARLEKAFWDRAGAAPLAMTAVGDRARAVPGILALRCGRRGADQLAMLLDTEGFAVSTGSACDVGKREASRGAKAVLGEQAARQGFIRLSFGRGTTAQDITAFATALAGLG
jgi:cysteine desulfurase